MTNQTLNTQADHSMAARIERIEKEDAAYFADPAISSTDVKAWAKSPAHYHTQEFGEPSTDMKLGTALHHCILHGISPEGAAKHLFPKSRANTIENYIELLSGQINALREHPTTRSLFFDWEGVTEKPIFWDNGDGVKLKCKPDRLAASPSGRRYVVDLKTAKDASERGFFNACRDYHYPLQDAHYSEGVQREYNLEELPPFVFVFIEKKAPYHLGIYTLPMWQRELALQQCYRSYHEISTSDPDSNEAKYAYSDPSVDGGINEVQLPDWALKITY